VLTDMFGGTPSDCRHEPADAHQAGQRPQHRKAG
jgi:hypothetical protein